MMNPHRINWSAEFRDRMPQIASKLAELLPSIQTERFEGRIDVLEMNLQRAKTIDL